MLTVRDTRLNPKLTDGSHCQADVATNDSQGQTPLDIVPFPFPFPLFLFFLFLFLLFYSTAPGCTNLAGTTRMSSSSGRTTARASIASSAAVASRPPFMH